MGGVDIVCASNELVTINPPQSESCASYLEEFIKSTGGSLSNPEAEQVCKLCSVSDTDTLLAMFGIYYDDRWMNFGITLVYTAFNIVAALILYWLARVPRKPKVVKK